MPNHQHESFWNLKVPKLGLIKFKTTQHGRLGIKTTAVPAPEKQKTYHCPACNSELSDTYRGKYCPVDRKYYLESESIISVRDRKTGREYTWDDFKKMYPRTLETPVVAIVDSSKVNYGSTDTSSSYFLVPVNDYDNILRYNQLVYLLKENHMTAITGPMILVDGSETKHVYAIFADLNRNCLIAIQLLVKEGLREVPAGAEYTAKVESPEMVATAKKKLYNERFEY